MTEAKVRWTIIGLAVVISLVGSAMLGAGLMLGYEVGRATRRLR